jgi:hypothetical protein
VCYHSADDLTLAVCIDGMLACRRLTLSYRPRSADGLDYCVVGMLGLVIDTPMPNLIRIILEVDTCNIVQDVGAPVKPRPLYLCGAGRSTLGLMRFKPDNFQFPASAVQSLIEVTVLVQDPCGIISCVKHMKTLLDILGPRGRCPGKNWGILTYRSYPKLDITS